MTNIVMTTVKLTAIFSIIFILFFIHFFFVSVNVMASKSEMGKIIEKCPYTSRLDIVQFEHDDYVFFGGWVFIAHYRDNGSIKYFDIAERGVLSQISCLPIFGCIINADVNPKCYAEAQ